MEMDLEVLELRKREACQIDYSKWLETIPDQMPNNKFERMKQKQIRQLAMKHKLVLRTVVEMFPK